MNILHVDHEKSWRGGQNQTFELISHLRNHKSFLATPEGSILSEKLKDFCANFPLTTRNDLDFMAGIKLKKIIAENNIDIVHAHTAKSHAAIIWAKFFGAKFKAVVHRRVLSDSRRKISAYLKYQSSKIDRYICVSNAVAEKLRQMGVNNEKIKTIPSGIDLKKFHSLNKTSSRQKLQIDYKIDSSKKIIVCAAHLSPLKGQKYLIEALRNLPRNFVCFFVGDGEDRKMLENMSENFQLRNRVFFTGFENSTISYLSAADICVLPTLWEGLGTILLEGALAGCALIASDVGGVPEIITHQVTGLLVPPQNSLALHNALADLLNSPEKTKTLADSAKSFVSQHFNFEEVALQTELLYNELFI